MLSIISYQGNADQNLNEIYFIPPSMAIIKKSKTVQVLTRMWRNQNTHTLLVWM